MRVIVTGDRNWSSDAEYACIRRRLEKLPEDSTIVHGGARGVDTMAAQAAVSLGLEVEGYPAEWTKYGRAAGPIRNEQMADSGADLVIAFHYDLSSSRGTADMVRQAKKRGIPVEVIDSTRRETK